MRVLPIDTADPQPDTDVAVLVSRMVFPDDDTEAEQVQKVMAEEVKRRKGDPTAPQGVIMASVEKELLRHETLGRMAGDVALKMIQDADRGRSQSLEFAASFVSEYYTSEQTSNEKYPADVSRLLKEFRRLKNSLHYWAAWQVCQDMDGFDFARDTAHLREMVVQAGLVQVSLNKLDYFSGWSPWLVPKDVIKKIRDERLVLETPEETEFEKAFAQRYSRKYGR